jgi:AcrR family transcriptional regulator
MPAAARTAKKSVPKAFSPAERRRRNRAEMTEAILDTAQVLMRAEGAAALNLNEVARRLGVKTPSLYEYFPGGKRQVYDALFRRGMERFGERAAAVSPDLPWPAYSRAQMEVYMQFARDFPELYQICFERPVPGFVPSPESLAVSVAAYQSAVAEMTRRLAAGELRPAAGLSPQQAVDLIISLTHGLTAQHMANEPHLPVGEGRYGSLISAAAALLEQAWTPQDPDGPEPEQLQTKEQ